MTALPKPSNTYYSALFCAEDERAIIITFIQREIPGSREYEKDEKPIESYTVGDITHYIFSNNKQIVAVWQNGYFECSIQGKITLDELKKMIDSIYE